MSRPSVGNVPRKLAVGDKVVLKLQSSHQQWKLLTSGSKVRWITGTVDYINAEVNSMSIHIDGKYCAWSLLGYHREGLNILVERMSIDVFNFHAVTVIRKVAK